MKNRIPTYAGRVRLRPVNGDSELYDMERADEPIQEGTPINKNLLDYALAANGVTSGTASALILEDEMGGFTLSDGAKINFRLHISPTEGATINVANTGAKPLLSAIGSPIAAGLAEGAWISATYSTVLDAYILEENSDSFSEADKEEIISLVKNELIGENGTFTLTSTANATANGTYNTQPLSDGSMIVHVTLPVMSSWTTWQGLPFATESAVNAVVHGTGGEVILFQIPPGGTTITRKQLYYSTTTATVILADAAASAITYSTSFSYKVA